MKWTVAGAGALLCVAGVYALISGGSIIQVERGWATFIAGAVLLGAGVVVIGIAALMGRIDRLTDLFHAAMSPAAAPSQPESEAVDMPQTVFHDVPPPPRAVKVDPLPTLESARPQSPIAPVAQVSPRREPALEERPAALRDFQFVFPPADMVPEAQAVAQEPPAPYRLETPASVEQLEKVSHGWRAGRDWLRSSDKKPTDVSPEPSAEDAGLQTEDKPERFVATELALEAAETQSAVAPPDEPEAGGIAQVEPEPAPAPEAPQAPASTLDPFGSDWLERALAGADEEADAASRLKPMSTRRAAIEQRLKNDSLQAADPASEPAQPEPESRSESEPDSDAPSAPVEIGRYRANDVAYVMFSDGSITAETPAGGSYRFNSLPELRAFIEKGAS